MNKMIEKMMSLNVLSFTFIPIVLLYLQRRKKQLRTLSQQSAVKQSNDASLVASPAAQPTNQTTTQQFNPIKVTILYSTTTGTAQKLATELLSVLSKFDHLQPSILNLKDYETDNLDSENIVLFLCSTWSNGTLAENSQSFLTWIEDLANDFRISKMFLGKVHYAIFGLGGQIYEDNFCKSSRELDQHMSQLGATSLLPLTVGDDASDLLNSFHSWSQQIEAVLKTLPSSSSSSNNNSNECCCSSSNQTTTATTTQPKRTDGVKRLKGTKRPKKSKELKEMNAGGGCCQSQPQQTSTQEIEEEVEVEEEDLINDAFVLDSDDDDEDNEDGTQKKNTHQSIGSCGNRSSEGVDEDLVDLEDIGPTIASTLPPPAATSTTTKPQTEREMVTKLQRKALIKEGYKIIGTHSAVKMCRWTKNQMRGRGGCYKHSFYGITSYQCMETTPSLACANKCVFCWRHHKNPVGTEWRWKVDPPALIVNTAIAEHRAIVNQMKGVPGVLPERYQEAFTVKHCALSLVGEPIMYPHINEMLQLLHQQKISTFLVTNAQFPEYIQSLQPVTQLYVSIDAATKDSLKAIDRPLFKDFWERFNASLDNLKLKEQRTVYRMTLVKDYNMHEIEQYCELIERGQPDFIEIKAVTYCGKSDASNLTMKNVPWHYEVCQYAELIVECLNQRMILGFNYSIATEHEHSCCILIAREDKFKVNNKWHTWINYSKYDELIEEYYQSGGVKGFTSVDYMAETPEWALYKSNERGFDPIESRWRKTKTGTIVEVEYKSSDSGCG